jgi:hypothetical protein
MKAGDESNATKIWPCILLLYLRFPVRQGLPAFLACTFASCRNIAVAGRLSCKQVTSSAHRTTAAPCRPGIRLDEHKTAMHSSKKQLPDRIGRQSRRAMELLGMVGATGLEPVTSCV